MDGHSNFQGQNEYPYIPSSTTRPLSIESARTIHDDNQTEALSNHSRQHNNLQGLLRFAMEATKVEDVPNDTIFPIDEERKQFLNEALSSISINIIEKLEKDIIFLKNIIQLRDDDDTLHYEAALDRVTDLTGSMDVANDFYKIGGFSIFKPCLNSPHNGIRWKIANLIAELAQNNPFFQEKILEAGFLPLLLSIIDSDKSELSRIKALYAVSCIVRGCTAGIRHMKINDGFLVLMRAIQSSVQKLQIKSAFLLASVCNEDKDNDLKLILIKIGLIEQACGLLAMSSSVNETREQLLIVLNGLVKNNYYPALKECRRPELCLKQTLERLLQESKLEDNVDNENICTTLLSTIFADLELE